MAFAQSKRHLSVYVSLRPRNFRLQTIALQQYKYTVVIKMLGVQFDISGRQSVQARITNHRLNRAYSILCLHVRPQMKVQRYLILLGLNEKIS